MALTILAQITAVDGKEDLVRTELEKLIAPTRAEQGCLQYDLHIDNENAGFFVFYENWASRDLWQQHMKAQHLTDFNEATKDAVANVTVTEMNKIA